MRPPNVQGAEKLGLQSQTKMMPTSPAPKGPKHSIRQIEINFKRRKCLAQVTDIRPKAVEIRLGGEKTDSPLWWFPRKAL